MKLAICQINTCMGNIAYNEKKMSQCLKELPADVDLAVFPELSLVGYPVKDFVFEQGFIKTVNQAMDRLIKMHPQKTFVFGSIEQDTQNRFYNVAVLVHEGQVVLKQSKSLLPQYDVFFEGRYFFEGQSHGVFKLKDKVIGLSVCEDIWSDVLVDNRYAYDEQPLKQLTALGMNLHINISASPFGIHKHQSRLEAFKKTIAQTHCDLVYCNLVGANDELVFDGSSCVINKDAQITHQAKSFEVQTLVFDLNQASSNLQNQMNVQASILSALILGVRDFVHKCGQSKVWIGLSGGIDSALCAVIAQKALGSKHVHVVFMPSEFSSEHSRQDAKELCQNLGIQLREISIQKVYDVLKQELNAHFESKKADSTEENLQARIRGQMLMALANKHGGLVLNTGNKSELATGYCTLYGDMVGALSVLSDLYKTQVYELCRAINAQEGLIPDRILTKAPSAELKPNQKDEDSLGPYSLLDEVLYRLIELKQNPDSIQGFDSSTVSKIHDLLIKSEFKRKQMPVGLKISQKAFGLGRIMPIAQKAL